MFSLKGKIGHFHVLVVQNSQKNYKKKCQAPFANWTYWVFLDVLVAVASLDVKVPTIQKDTLSHPPQIASGGQSTHRQILKNESRRCIKIFQICQNHDAIIVFLQSKNKKLKKKMQNKKQKYTSQNGNPHPWTETHNQKKGAQIPIRQNISYTRKNKPKMETQQWKQNQRYKTETTTRKRYVTENRLSFIISWYKTNGRIMPSVKLSIKIVPSLPRISFLLPLPRVISRQLQEKQAFCFPELAQGGGEELCLALIPVKFTTQITL